MKNLGAKMGCQLILIYKCKANPSYNKNVIITLKEHKGHLYVVVVTGLFSGLGLGCTWTESGSWRTKSNVNSWDVLLI